MFFLFPKTGMKIHVSIAAKTILQDNKEFLLEYRGEVDLKVSRGLFRTILPKGEYNHWISLHGIVSIKRLF